MLTMKTGLGGVKKTLPKMMMPALLALGCASGAGAARAEGCRVADFGTLPVEVAGGRATTMVKINGHDTPFILDTGAFFSTMSRAKAQELGLTLEMAPQGFYISGVGGDAGVNLAHVKDFGILGSTLHNILFIVGGSDTGMGLLGANLLELGDLDADLAQGKAKLLKPNLSCQKVSMAYWAPDGNYNIVPLLAHDGERDRNSRVTVMINGKPVKAELDTGAPTTVITRRAAARAGIDLSPGATKPAGSASGIGKRHYDSVIARVALYQVGSESIQNSRMSVIDGDIETGNDPIEMLLGLDFFLSHHIFIANSQHKIYFSYNGGRVSAYDKLSETHPAATPNAPAVQDLDGKGEPDTAHAFGLRGQARLSRGETAAGLADLDKALTMAPQDPASVPFYRARALARLETGRTGSDAALADLDAALRLAPGSVDLLVMRARLLLARHETARAHADVEAARQAFHPGGDYTADLAILLIDEERPAEALPLLDAWIRLHPDDSRLGAMLNQRCWARGLANTLLAEAQEDCRKAIKRGGANADVLDSLALIQLRLGQYQAAIDSYTQVLAKAPKLSWSRYGMGLAKLYLGQAAGKADIAAALAAEPGLSQRAAHYGLTPPGS